ncbi:DEAD/DEAH box helicase [Salinigranum salinum]|uniref:DEAD/DEAH box helicase n=1 Tax=Salinigranum salinum TaxID=1364937 RepID=UPI00126132E6|nr:DEAD/DEAH box helicase [Salinigranum salinum]
MAATPENDAYVDHPLLSPGFIERRRYQLSLASAATDAHTLVCLPTGLGKTTVSLLVTAERLHAVGGTSLMLAPTKPLVQQHADFYREALSIPDDEIVVFTGEVRPDDRAALWDDARVVIATPQVVENDLIGNRISLAGVTHLTFDECHRATGDYAYVYIADRYHADAADPLVTGMSASPGGDKEAILQVCENLGLSNVEVMTDEDADVADYTHDTDVEWNRVQLPDQVLQIRDALNEVVTDRLEKLKEMGVTNRTSPDLSQKELNGMRAELQRLINAGESEGYQGMSVHAEIMKLRRAVELVETQSVESVRRYFERQRNAARSSGASKASQRLVAEPKVREAMRLAESFDGIHPKFSKTRILLAETLGIGGGERVIVFTESRDTAEALVDFLAESFHVRKFVGQSDTDGSEGMTQTEQQETLDEFRNGEFEVLVSTSVAEEGLDVPEVDLVLFFEPVPTAIRSIQRKGRTGRQAKGRVVVLLAEDTRDEAFFWISRRREREMAEELRDLKGVAAELERELEETTLGEFEDDEGESDGRTEDDAGAGESTTGSEPATTPATNGSGARDSSLTEFASSAGTTGAAETDTERRDAGGVSEAIEETDGSDGTDEAGETGGTGGTGTDEAHDARETGTDDVDPDPEGTVATADATDDPDVVEIVVDQRELDSTIARELSTREGVRTRLETLAVGDYVLSDRVVVERKTVPDFLDTLLGSDRSLFAQARDASRHYARPVVVIEGDGLYEERNVHPGAIRGAIASLAVDFGVSVLHTRDEADTTELLSTIATREQTERDRKVSVHGEKAAKTLDEQQEYVVGAIADVGPVTAQSLLSHLGSVEAVMTASEEELQEVRGVGAKTAARIREVVGSDYAFEERDDAAPGDDSDGSDTDSTDGGDE